MAKLLVNPGSPTAWEIQLKPGTNSLGRGVANDFKIEDPSVSGLHCQIVIGASGATIKDLGSTNGTYVNRAPVQEATLQAGQTVHLGGVQMVFQAEELEPINLALTEIEPPRPATIMVTPPPPMPAPAMRVSTPPMRVSTPAPPTAAPRISVATPAEPPAATATGSGPCKFHPKTPGRYLCAKCRQFFCELCVASRAVAGAQKKFCRHCGTELTAVHVHIERAVEKGFFARLPAVFVYPFKGSGLLVLIVATLVFAGLEIVSMGWMSWLMKAAAIGYFFSYMQNIIHSTASEDDTMPELPGMDDLFGSFFRLAGTVMLCFGAPIVMGILKIFLDWEIPMSAIIATTVLGCLYFPMALLAVAMKDSALAANPLVVIPAITKAPLEYVVAAVLVVGVFGLRQVGNMIMSAATASEYSTRDMSVLFTAFGLRAAISLVNVYLLTISMRILGIIYVTKKRALGWFSH